MDTLNTFNSYVSPLLTPLTTSPWNIILTMMLGVYAANARQALPTFLSGLFQKGYFRVAVLFMILWIGNHDPALSLVSALAFAFSLNIANGRGLFEFFGDEYAMTAVLPGCLNVNTYHILSAFNNDKDKLIQAMVQAGVPPNVQFNDDYAALISTYLVNNLGMSINDFCKLPGSAY